MINGLLGTKISQTQMFDAEGKRMPVTTILAGPCWITQITEKQGYRSVQLGFGTLKTITKAIEGHIKKAGLDTKPRFLREFRGSSEADLKTGQRVSVSDIFAVGDSVSVSGTSKGKGFAGVVKRHGFRGGPRTHGQSDRERAPGSIGQTTTPGRVYRGKRMAGRMGNNQVTLSSLSVIAIDPEKNILTVKGLVPGAKNGLLLIEKA